MATDLPLLDRATRTIVNSSENARVEAEFYAAWSHGHPRAIPILFQRIRWQYDLMLAGAGGMK